MVLIIGLINLGGPQSAQAQQVDLADTDPRLATLSVSGIDNLTRDQDGSEDLSDTSTTYMGSVAYEVTSVEVTAIAESSPASSVTITLPRRGGSTTTSPTAPVELNVGDNVFKVKVVEDDNNSNYTDYTLTVKRNLPDLNSLGLRAVGNNGDGDPDPDQTTSAAVDLDPAIPTDPAEEATLLMSERMFEASVPYDVDSTTIQVDVGTDADLTNEVTEAAEAMRVAFSGLTLATSTMDTTTGEYNAVVNLKVGTNNLRITVRGSGGDFSTSNSQAYTVAIERRKPELSLLVLEEADATAFDSTDTSVQRHGPETASTTAEGILAGNPDNLEFIATTTSYTARVGYARGSVRVEGTPNAMVKVVYRDATDTIPSTGVMDMDLDRGVNRVTVRAVATDDTRNYTDYKIEITRENTPLLTLELTNPSTTTLAANGSTFAPATSTEAFTSVEYRYESIEVEATANADTMIKLTGGGDTTTGTETLAATTRTLDVGDNEFEIMAGVSGNTSTYVLTVTRDEPKPQIEFTVVNSGGVDLGSGPLPLTLDAASRSYDLVDRTDITDDDLLTATDVRICVNDASARGEDDVNVSINGVTVPDCDDDYLERELNEVTTNLEFDIDHPGDLSGTLHTVTISRTANSVPMFPANHILRSRTGESGVLAVHNTTITPTVELPTAMGGNGALTYELLSVEADGPSTDLPAGLTYDLPSSSGNGELNMSPSILDSSDRAVFNLILKVSDSDALMGSSDEDTIPFTIIVFRDESLLPPGTTIEPRLGDLRDLQVREDVDGDGSAEVDQLEPDFSLLVYSYSADVLTDTTEVDFVATASSDATVRLEGNVTSNTDTTGDETTHTWEGYKLNIGPGARNTYRVTVAEGPEVTRTYTVRVERELAKKPMFAMGSAVMEYYEGIPLSELPDSAAALPEAVKDSGNGAFNYTLKRNRDDAPDKDDFLNLMLVGATSTPMLSGTPVLDDEDKSDRRLSDRSEAYGVYTVHDADMDETAADADTMKLDVKVYRDVTLASYTVSGSSSGGLGEESKVYKSNRTYSHASLESYRFNAAHDVTMVTFSANPNGADASIVSIMPADADASTDGHQLNLARGNNVVTVTVGNGVVRGTHLINIKRPGLQLTSITITEDEDARDNSRLSDDVELVRPDDMKGFNRDVYEYTATVETWVRSVQVRATAADSTARVFVNTFEIPEREGYSVVDLEIGETTIVLGASVGTDEPDPRYTVTITRKSSSAPAFEMDAMDYTRMEGVDVAMAPCTAIILPEAMSGDGALTYYLVNEEQLPPGLTFDGATREIAGIPTLDEGYESDFDLILAVRDSDADTSDADGDTTSFTITITNDSDKVAEDCAVATPEPDLPANQLSSLLVTYTLDGRTDIPATMWSPMDFSPSNGGPYTVSIPFGATDVQVTAVRADAGATISMNSVRIVSGVKLDLPPQAEIAVRHPSFTESMVYTLNTERVSNTAPTFGGATVDDVVYESGMDIDSMTLPVATGGNRTLTYTLEDHEGNLPDGLMFDASSRELSGRPALVQDADETLYRMTYMVEDADGQSDTIMFNITVCDPDRAMGCQPTMPEPNPGSTPVDLMVTRSGNTATLTWRPGDDAASQAVLAIDPSNLLASAMATFMELDGDADNAEISGLDDGVNYIYVVAGFDADGNHKDASGNLYFARHVEGN